MVNKLALPLSSAICLSTTSNKANNNCSCLQITALFDMARPHMDFDFSSIQAHINTVYVLTTKEGSISPNPELPEVEQKEVAKLRLKGQVISL